MKTKKWLSVIGVCFVMFFALSVKVNASDITDETLDEVYCDFAFAHWVSNDAYFESGDAVPEETVHWYLIMSGVIDQYYDETDWNHRMTYEQYLEAVDRCFTNHTDMKKYLTEMGYYDEATGQVEFFAGGLGGGFTWLPTIRESAGKSTYKVSGLFLYGEEPITDGMVEYRDYIVYDDWEWEITDIEELTIVDTEEGLKIDAFVATDRYIYDDMYFTKGSDDVAYKLTLEMDAEVSCGGTVAGGEATKETVSISKIDGSGYDYYLWPDSKTSLAFNVEEGYSINEFKLVPDTAGILVQSAGNNIVTFSLTEPASLQVICDDKVIRTSEEGLVLTANAADEGWFRGIDFVAERATIIEDKINAELGEDYEVVAYDMHLEFSRNGEVADITEKIPMEITVSMPEGWFEESVSLYWADGKAIDISEYSVTEDSITIRMDALNTFVLCRDITVENPDDSTLAGWKQDSVGWWYQNEDGSYPVSEWVLIDGEYYYFDVYGYRVESKWQGDYYLGTDGAMATNAWIGVYYVDASGKYQTGWLETEDGWYYLGSDGAVRTGWFQVGAVWYYGQKDKEGLLIENDWFIDGSSIYYFLDSCAMARGWIETEDGWYYLGSSGAMCFGWCQVANTWYYFDEDGLMISDGIYSIDGKLYAFDESGAMITGWIYEEIEYDNGEVEVNWYYAGGSGAFITGWANINNIWYYFDLDEYYMYSDGVYRIYTNDYSCSYAFDKSGAMVTGWYSYDDHLYYFNSNGEGYYGWLKEDGKTYCFSDGKAYKNEINSIGFDGYFFGDDYTLETTPGWYQTAEPYNNWIYVKNNSGVVHKGWLQLNGNWYYMSDRTILYDKTPGSSLCFSMYESVYSCIVEIQGVRYKFDENGVWIP